MARIVLIEDNRDNLDLMVYLLQAYAHTTLPASTGQAGLAAAQQELPDLVLCDLQLPDIDGFEVARQIRRDPALHHVPLLAVTAYAMVGDRQNVLAAGFDGYLTKPLDPEIFVGQVEAFLLPGQRSRPLESHAAVGQAVPLPPQRARILVVDDTTVNLDLMRSILEPSGFAVEVAQQVSAALAQARRSPPDLILSNLYMPVRDGYELLRAIQDDPALSRIPIVIYTAAAASSKEQAVARSLGAAKFLSGPVEPHALLAQIEACLSTTSDQTIVHSP